MTCRLKLLLALATILWCPGNASTVVYAQVRGETAANCREHDVPYGTNQLNALAQYDPQSDNVAASALSFRVVVDTDLGGDPDDIQSLFRLIHYSDILKVEAIISSPGPGSEPKAELIKHWIQRADVDHLRARGYVELSTEDELLKCVFTGSRTPGAPAAGRTSDGARQIIRCAHRDDPRPLWVLVWGSMTTLAQALHDDASIAPRLRIYSIGSSNTIADPASRDYVFEFMKTQLPTTLVD